jgi:hypothetical protein
VGRNIGSAPIVNNHTAHQIVAPKNQLRVMEAAMISFAEGLMESRRSKAESILTYLKTCPI